jgi:subtilisin
VSRRSISNIYRKTITGYSVYLTEYEWGKAERIDVDGFGVTSITESWFGQFQNGPIADSLPLTTIADGQEVVPTGILRSGSEPKANRPVVDYSNVDVGVIDTGVDRMHPDLNVVGGEDCVAATGDTPDYGMDGNGHGSHVAGTIAARANGIGVVGMAPSARIHSYKALNAEGSGSFASVLCAIEAAAEDADILEVVNMSLGGQGRDSACGGEDPMHNAICSATDLGIIFVVAAGNSSADASGHIPASYPEVVTVSAWADFNGQPGGGSPAPQSSCFASSRDDDLASYTNYGSDVDIAAPGTCILSTAPGTLVGVGGYDPNFSIISGTSMASPHVAGCFARFLALNPDQAEWARKQILAYSEAHEVVSNDPDGLYEPLLYCDQVPRYEGSEKTFPGGA